MNFKKRLTLAMEDEDFCDYLRSAFQYRSQNSYFMFDLSILFACEAERKHRKKYKKELRKERFEMFKYNLKKHLASIIFGILISLGVTFFIACELTASSVGVVRDKGLDSNGFYVEYDFMYKPFGIEIHAFEKEYVVKDFYDLVDIGDTVHIDYPKRNLNLEEK